MTGGLANAMISVNLPQIQGTLGLTPVEGAWLPAAYVMVNVSANLILFKCRQQFGVRRFAEVAISANLAMIVLYLLSDTFEMALLVRAISGFASAPMSALGLYYILQAFPKAALGRGLCVGIGLTQLGTPLAYVISPTLLEDGTWHSLYHFEFGMALCSLAGVFALKLPPSIRLKVFEARDLFTVLLVVPGFALIVAVLSQGRVQWWMEQPWMGWALISALALLLAGFYLEHYRENPMIQTRWLGSAEVLRFVLGALTLRLLLSEQTYTVVGLLKALGMGPDQLVRLYAVICLGTVTGILVSAITFGQKTIMLQIIASVAMIIAGSLMDRTASSLTRPHDLLVSQFLIAVAAGMFMGPMMLIGVMKALGRGGDYILTFSVLFALTQGMGGMAGSALFGTMQIHRQHEHSAMITAQANPTNPVVAQRIQIYGQAFQPTITDPVIRQARGAAMLAEEATREANVRAYNDLIAVNALIAISFLTWSFADIYLQMRKTRRQPAGAGAAAGAAAV
jgi:MFS family permease